MTTTEVLAALQRQFPDAHCELIHHNAYELLVAVVLSAQTTDQAVNRVTGALFARYPDAFALAKAKQQDVEGLIRSIGLYRSKAKNLIALAEMVCADYGGAVPGNREDLMRLPGVGRKSANVILSVWFHVPSLAVDTHVERVSKRIGWAQPQDSPAMVEQKLMERIPVSQWSQAHHLLLFFGRYCCTARHPHCVNCSLQSLCRKDSRQPEQVRLP